jgi:hypothetical protein
MLPDKLPDETTGIQEQNKLLNYSPVYPKRLKAKKIIFK